MLTWDDTPQEDQKGKVLSVSYEVEIPHWGKASIRPHIYHPGEMVLDCPGLGIKAHSLGKVFAEDAIIPAERALVPGGFSRYRPPRELTGRGRQCRPCSLFSFFAAASH